MHRRNCALRGRDGKRVSLRSSPTAGRCGQSVRKKWQFPSTSRVVSEQWLIRVVAGTPLREQPERWPLESHRGRRLRGGDRADLAPRPSLRNKEHEQPKKNGRL